MEIQDPVLAVIDMQKGFVNEHSSHIVENVCHLISQCESLSVPIVFSRFFNFADSPYEVLIGWDSVHSAPETEIIDELLPAAGTLIDKKFYTALTPDFVEIINQNGWKTVILCGIATESCVLKTAADAFELGLRPIVISDACASGVGHASHLAGLLALVSLIGKNQIMTSDELISAVA